MKDEVVCGVAKYMNKETEMMLCRICSAVGALSQSGLMLDERALRSIAPAIDQLNSVFNEVCLLKFDIDC